MSATRNPIQPRPTPLPGDNRHYGPGYRRTAESLVGPTIKRTKINPKDQSARSNAAENGEYEMHGSSLGDNPHQISREELTPGNLENYGAGD